MLKINIKYKYKLKTMKKTLLFLSIFIFSIMGFGQATYIWKPVKYFNGFTEETRIELYEIANEPYCSNTPTYKYTFHRLEECDIFINYLKNIIDEINKYDSIYTSNNMTEVFEKEFKRVRLRPVTKLKASYRRDKSMSNIYITVTEQTTHFRYIPNEFGGSGFYFKTSNIKNLVESFDKKSLKYID